MKEKFLLDTWRSKGRQRLSAFRENVISKMELISLADAAPVDQIAYLEMDLR
jgi:hypothetical protein